MHVSESYPNYFHIDGIVYVALSVIEAMQFEKVEVYLVEITSGADLSKPFYCNAFLLGQNPWPICS